MKNASHHSHCLNCGTPLAGPFCSKCGQHDVDYSGSFWHVIEESLEGLLHFDGKFLKSLRYIFTRPGFLTLEFNEGRRVRYTHPLRFYFFASFLFFAAGVVTPRVTTTETKPVSVAHEAPVGAGAKATAASQTDAPQPDSTLKKKELNFTLKTGTSNSVLDRLIKDDIPLDEQGMKTLVSETTHFMPVALFLGVPVLALFLKLAYLRSGRSYIDHLVFGLHIQAFVFMAALVAKALLFLESKAGDTALAVTQGLATLAGLWIVFRAMRVVYGQGRWITAFKLVVVGILYEFVLGVGLLALLIATAVALHHRG